MKKNSIKTLVFGASLKEERYSNIAIHKLVSYGHEVVAIGGRKGEVLDIPIHTDKLPIKDLHTITMYMGAQRQEEYYEYLLKLKPQRIIFNPGAENPVLYDMAVRDGIVAMNACTLVLLSTKQYYQKEELDIII